MKNKWLIGIYIALVLFLVVDKFQLADKESTKNADLIGMMVTSEDIYTFGEREDTSGKTYSSPEKAIAAMLADEPRIEATLVKKEITDENNHKKIIQEYEFQQKEVLAYYYESRTRMENEEFDSVELRSKHCSDVSIHVSSDNDETGVEKKSATISGNVYFPISNQKEIIYHIGYIYQREDGSIYATGGSSYGMNTSYPGDNFGHSKSQTQKLNTGKKPSEKTITLNLNSKTVYAPEQFVLIQMNEQTKVLDSKKFLPGEMPEQFAPRRDTSLILLQSFTNDEQGKPIVQYTITDRSKAELEYMNCDEQICEKNTIEVQWEKSAK